MRNSGSLRLVLALVVAGFSLLAYFGSGSVNPVTGKTERVGAMSVEQEIAIGLQAAPQMAAQHGGQTADGRARDLVDRVGRRLLERSGAGKSAYRFQFHALADRQTVNAFALPGGQVFITEALLRRLRTEGELGGVLAHEVGHVIARHGAQRIAKQQLTQGLTGAAVLASYDPNDPSSQRSAQVVALIGGLVNLKYGRDDEIESDTLGVQFMSEAGYDPRAMVGVMEVLKAASGGGRAPEFFSTHPNPENRIARIQRAIQERFPDGVPENLER